MTVNEALAEWYSRKRRMGCVSGSEWFCKRVPGFYTLELDRYTKNGEYFGHTVATNGRVIIDITPYADLPRDYNKKEDGILTGSHFGQN